MRPQLSVLWEHRLNGRLNEARDLYLSIKKESASLSELEAVEMLLVEASFLRHEMNIAESNERLVTAKINLQQLGEWPHFQWTFQSALNLDAGSKFAESLKLYQEALRIASDDNEVLLAAYNLAICQYNLNIPNKKALTQVEALLRKNPEHPFKTGFQQIQWMQMERDFLRGDFHHILNQRTNDDSQAMYHQALLQTLPWGLSGVGNARDRFLERAASAQISFQQNYTLQTLLADPRFLEDHIETTVQLQVDRIFLWAWQWLANPTPLRAELLARTLNQFPFEKAHLTMTGADFYMLVSVGNWLSRFDNRFSRFFSAWERKAVPDNLPGSEFFELDARLANGMSPGAAQTMPGLDGYFACVERINAEIKSAQHTDSHLDEQKSLVLRQDDWTASKGAISVVSEPLVRLLSYLKLHDSASFETALSVAFEISGYEAIDHAPKIQNLLQRAKSLLPSGVQLSTKNGRIYFKDDSNKVRRVVGSLHVQNFPKLTVGRQNLGKKQSVRLEKQLKGDQFVRLITLFQEENSFSRQQIQSRLGLSKATANRWISEWLADQVLERTGKGRVSTYRLSRIDSRIPTQKHLSGRKATLL